MRLSLVEASQAPQHLRNEWQERVRSEVIDKHRLIHNRFGSPMSLHSNRETLRGHDVTLLQTTHSLPGSPRECTKTTILQVAES